MAARILFKVQTPLGVEVRTTYHYWKIITQIKHPSIQGKQQQARQTLKNPDVVRKSQQDNRVYLYYKKYGGYYLTVVCRHLDGEGFIITCYYTKKPLEGKTIWSK